eukprot:8647158-Alexandrium_andersonii.AAC.1
MSLVATRWASALRRPASTRIAAKSLCHVTPRRMSPTKCCRRPPSPSHLRQASQATLAESVHSL